MTNILLLKGKKRSISKLKSNCLARSRYCKVPSYNYLPSPNYGLCKSLPLFSSLTWLPILLMFGWSPMLAQIDLNPFMLCSKWYHILQGVNYQAICFKLPDQIPITGNGWSCKWKAWAQSCCSISIRYMQVYCWLWRMIGNKQVFFGTPAKP